MVLETTFTATGGTVTLTDALVVGRDERGHDLGASAVNAVMRRVVGVTGSVEMVVDYAPRPEYATVTPTLRPFDGGVASSTETMALVLSSTVPLGTEAATGSARFTLGPGDSAAFALQYATLPGEPPRSGRVRRSATGWPRPPSRGAPGRGCTRTTRARGRASST